MDNIHITNKVEFGIIVDVHISVVRVASQVLEIKGKVAEGVVDK